MVHQEWSRRAILALPVGLALTHTTFSGMQQTDLSQLPPNLPRPQDDGAARHLKGMRVPDLELPSTANQAVNLSRLSARRTVIYCYPMTGQPGKPLPAGWDEIPGARGCTLETCGFRDHHQDLARLNVDVYGVSTQDTAYQQEMIARLKVPFEVLSDQRLAFARALRLPTFTVEGMTLLKRLTLVVRHGTIEHVFYPVFPPDAHVEEVITWLKGHA